MKDCTYMVSPKERKSHFLLAKNNQIQIFKKLPFNYYRVIKEKIHIKNNYFFWMMI